MHSRILIFIVAIILAQNSASGQLSPGKLTNAHSDLEGIRNCTLCHDIGKKVSDTKCLDCHGAIDDLLNNQQGYHNHPTVRSLNCFECHSEHHGRNFEMIRFDETAFDHQLTGYPLEGKHATTDCRACHAPDKIVNPNVVDRTGTFLGLDAECMACHNDYHQGTLSSDCTDCHSTEAFRPAPFFDHDQSLFRLEGAHNDVSCLECHPVTVERGVKRQQFSNLEVTDCSSCHTSPHEAQLPGNCTDCHNESSFGDFDGATSFDHNQTNFQLQGAHRRVSCFDCHQADAPPNVVFREFTETTEASCIDCHVDSHEGKFGQQCIDCHNVESFTTLAEMDEFDHGLTDYPLIGMHEVVDCRACHQDNSYTAPLRFETCTQCHDDAHDGQFTEQGVTRDCATCHSVATPFSYTLYDIDEHLVSQFPLKGGHVATPCFSCHLVEDEWEFRNLGNDCIDCHNDQHEGLIPTTYYPDQNCTQCHNEASWSAINFDHRQTDWDLQGRHQIVACRNCHVPDYEETGMISQVFTGVAEQCYQCHEDIHLNQFADEEGITNCNNCHISENWGSLLFDHNKTKFTLAGRHAELSCTECHQPPYNGDPDVVLYKIPSFQCIDCHL